MLNTITDHPTLEIGIISIVSCIIGVVILMGKGDWLIAGYNTASKEEKKTVNIRRLRWITAIICWLSAVYIMLLIFLDGTPTTQLILPFGFVFIVLLALIMSNTWAKRK